MIEELLILCEECKGHGYWIKSIKECPHKNIDKHTDKKCKDCNGTGRQIKEIETKYRPYKKGELHNNVKVGYF